MAIAGLNVNWVDLIAVLVLIYFARNGVQRGFLSWTFSLMGVAVAAYLAVNLAPVIGAGLGQRLDWMGGVSSLVALVVLFFLAAILVEFLASLLLGPLLALVEISPIRPINQIAGVVPATITGFALFALLFTTLIRLPFPSDFRDQLAESYVGQRLLNQDQWVVSSLNKAVEGLLTEDILSLRRAGPVHQPVQLTFYNPQTQWAPALEQQLLQLINSERTARGLPPLQLDQRIVSAARVHSKEMFDTGYFAHDSPTSGTLADRLRQSAVRYGIAGENIALAPTLAMIHRGLMESPGHRANILDPDYRRIGIGIADGGIYGLMATEDFTD